MKFSILVNGKIEEYNVDFPSDIHVGDAFITDKRHYYIKGREWRYCDDGNFDWPGKRISLYLIADIVEQYK